MADLKKAVVKLLKTSGKGGMLRKDLIASLVASKALGDKTTVKAELSGVIEKLEAKNKVVCTGKRVEYVATPKKEKKRKAASAAAAAAASAADDDDSPKAKKRRNNDDEDEEDEEKEAIDRLHQQHGGRPVAPSSSSVPSAQYPPPPEGKNSILLFYAYCDPQMTRAEQDNAIAHCYGVLQVCGIGMESRPVTSSRRQKLTFVAFMCAAATRGDRAPPGGPRRLQRHADGPARRRARVHRRPARLRPPHIRTGQQHQPLYHTPAHPFMRPTR